MRQTVSLALLVGVLGVALLFRSLIGQPGAETLWADNYDARLLSWIAEWGYQIIAVRGSPLDFWNAPSFYPHVDTLAYSDSLLSLQLIYTPLRLLGFGALPALYTSLALFSIIACVLSARALHQLFKFTRVELAVTLFVLHFGLSIAGYLPHYQIFGFQFAPPFFLQLLLWLRSGQARYLLGATSLFVIATCFATYLLPMLVTLSLITALPLLLHGIRLYGPSFYMRPLSLNVTLGIAVLLSFLYFAQVRHYLRIQEDAPKSSFDEAWLYSGRPWSLFVPAKGGNSLWYTPPPHKARFGDAERAYFPGYLVLFLFTFGLYQASKRRAFDAHTCVYFLFLFVATAVLALGPYVHQIRMPFYYLSHLLPGLDRVRAPGRFGILLSLPLAIFAAAGLAAIRQKFGRQRPWLVPLLAALLVIEVLPYYRTFPFKPDEDGVYTKVAALIQRGAAVIEVPIAGGDNLKSISRITEQLHGTLIHGGRIIVGYGARNSPEAEELAHLDLKLYRGKARFKDLLSFAEQQNVSFLIIRIARYPKAMQERWRKALKSPRSLSVTWLNPNVAVVQR